MGGAYRQPAALPAETFRSPYPDYGGAYPPQDYRSGESAPPPAGEPGWAAPADPYRQPEHPARYEPPHREPKHAAPPPPSDPYAAPSGYGYGADPRYPQQPSSRRAGGGFVQEENPSYPPRSYEPAADYGYSQPYYDTARRYPSPTEPYARPYGRGESPSQESSFSAQGFGAPAVPQAPAPPLTVNRRTPKPSMDELLQNFGEGVGLGKGLDPSKPSITPRRSAPMMGKQEEPQPPAAAARVQSPAAPRRFDYAPPAYPPLKPPPVLAGESQFVPSAGMPSQTPVQAPPYPERFQIEPAYEQNRFPSGAYPEPGRDRLGESYPAAEKPAGGRFDPARFTLTEPEGPAVLPAREEPAPSLQPDPPVQGGWAGAATPAFENFGQAETGFQAPPQAGFTETAAPPPEPSFPEPDPFFPPEEAEEPLPSFSKQEYTPPPFDQEATRMTEIDDSLRNATVSHVSLAPEDTQDDVDIDEEGRTLDASSGEEERQEILRELRHNRTSLLTRLGVTLAAFAGLCFLALAYMFPDVPTPPFMWAEGDTMRTFLIVDLALVVLAMLLNYSIIGGGLVSLFTFKADNDSLLSLAMVAAVSQSVALIVTPEAADLSAGVHLYNCIPVLGICFNLFGKLMTMKRVALGSRIVCGEGEKYVMRTIRSEDFSRQLSRGLPSDLPEITYSVKTRYVSGFLQASYAQDYAEGINRVLVLICLGASAAVAAASYFVSETRSIYLALTVFSALLTVCSPFTSTIVGNAPMLRAARKLQKSGAVIAGYPVVEEYSEVKAATFKAKELFPEDSITLSSMKVFQESLIEQAILDAASVICATDSPLAPIFKGMINSNEKILKPVDNIVYEDAMGLSAWVDGKRVLIGNAQLMANHGIATPSRDYEHRYVGEGRQILYLSNSGELIAMFALSYEADGRVAAQMKELADGGVSLIIHSTDPNITPQRISELYHYPQPYIKIVPANLHADYNRILEPRGRARASIIYSGTIMSMFRALGIIPRIKAAVTAGTACQLLATLIGYAVITFFAFFAGMANISFIVLLLYQLIWAGVVAFVIALRRI